MNFNFNYDRQPCFLDIADADTMHGFLYFIIKMVCIMFSTPATAGVMPCFIRIMADVHRLFTMDTI